MARNSREGVATTPATGADTLSRRASSPVTLASLESLDPRTRGFDLFPPRSRKQDVESALGLRLARPLAALESACVSSNSRRDTSFSWNACATLEDWDWRIVGLSAALASVAARDPRFSGRGARLKLWRFPAPNRDLSGVGPMSRAPA